MYDTKAQEITFFGKETHVHTHMQTCICLLKNHSSDYHMLGSLVGHE